MGLPWGVKETVAADHVAAVGEFIAKFENADIALGGEGDFKAYLFMKGGLKERKGEHLLIFRYQLT